jgi:hypothetical protein
MGPFDDGSHRREAVPGHLYPDLRPRSHIVQPARGAIRATERTDDEVVATVAGVHQRRRPALSCTPARRAQEQARDAEEAMPDPPVGHLVDRLMQVE